MAVTKEQVLEKATELSLTLTETEVDQYVKDGKLPEKADEPDAGVLQKQYQHRELAEMYRDACAEAKKYRLEKRDLKEQLEKVSAQLNDLTQAAGKIPELEAQVKAGQEMAASLKESEKSRRVLALSKLPDEQRKAVEYMANPETVKADQFDQTLALLVQQKNGGAGAPTPGESKEANPFAPKTRNLTAQIKLKREQPELAAKLEREAAAA